MPLFFFDVGDDDTWIRDTGGVVLDHRMDVPREAVTLVTEMMVDGSIEQDRRSIACLVRDEAGRHVYRVSLDLRGSWDVIGHPTVTGRRAASPPGWA